MHNVVLSPISTDVLIERIAERTAELLLKLTPVAKQEKEEDLITRKEALIYLGISSATLWRYEQQEKIQSYGLSGKRYFKKSEIDASLIQKK